jgi:glycosyltransferase involved in cell wall biosynthesis
MRIAIFHDYFSFIGGGEKLVLALARNLGADVISTDVDHSLISRMGYDDVKVISLGNLARSSPLKQIQATLKFEYCDFCGKYDFYLFSGNWAHHASRRHHPGLYYCNTPVRVFYDQRESFLKSQKNPIVRAAATAWIVIHSYFSRRSIARVERIIANSKNVAARIKKYYGMDSEVIYPGVDTSRFRYIADDGFWLSVNRLYPEKRVDVQIRAFTRMPDERLVIVGNSGKGDHSVAYAQKLKESLPPNVRILSDIDEEELVEYYGRCRGLITTPVSEDFGLTAVEAMASGKPVIAVKEGGYLETVVDGVTGALIDCNEDEIINAIKAISKDPRKYREACLERSKRFDVGVLLSRIRGQIDKAGP